jgi:hypothetical protein
MIALQSYLEAELGGVAGCCFPLAHRSLYWYPEIGEMKASLSNRRMRFSIILGYREQVC